MAGDGRTLRREMDRALTNTEHLLLHLAYIRDKLNDGQHQEYVEMIDGLGQMLVGIKPLLEEMRNLL